MQGDRIGGGRRWDGLRAGWYDRLTGRGLEVLDRPLEVAVVEAGTDLEATASESFVVSVGAARPLMGGAFLLDAQGDVAGVAGGHCGRRRQQQR